MKKSVSRTLAMALAACMAAGTLAACGSSGSSAVASSAAESTADSTAASTESGTPDYSNEDPINIRIYLSDNATLPYKEDWLTFTEVQKRCNVNLDVEAIPIADYSTKVSLALNTGENVPDVILYQSTTGENASLALNGALVPISDYSDWTPNFNARVEEMNLQDDVDMLNLQDGKRYYMPSLTDKPFYDGGLILREDYLESKGLEAPKTFDDLYEILKAYKADYPDSYPLTILAGPRVLFRMTMPSFGISVGKNSADGSYVLSYDYDNKDFFAGAIDDKCKEYFAFLNKLYAEGLLDPEMADPIDGDKWSQKLATGSSMATYAYYDQIGGVEAASEIDGFKLQMYAPLEGPAGAHHQPKSRTGSDVTQMVWINEREMSKYDENYAEINTEVAAMDDAIQPVPPTPQFDDLTAEDAASLRTPLGDTFEVWADAFITGKKSTDTDWDAYVAEMKNLSIDQYLQMYNDNNK